MKKVSIDECTIVVIPHDEDIPVRGNAMASGDDKYDKQVEDSINRKRLLGDIWAWCMVEVRVEFKGVKGTAYLGGCSYEDEEDFKAGGYYDDLVAEALADLNRQLASLQREEK